MNWMNRSLFARALSERYTLSHHTGHCHMTTKNCSLSRRLNLVALGALATIAIIPRSRSATPYPTPSELQQTLLMTANMLNKKMPMVIDRYTTLTSTNAELNNTFTFRYEIEISGGNIDYRELGGRVTNGYCTAPNFDIFRKYNVPVNWDYYTPDGRFLRRFTTTMALCN